MTNDIQPGLLVLHSNRAELLGDALFEWLRRHPLQPLEEEVFLVQSNGVAEWLKMTLAAQTGICAATRVELPGRFLWRSYRQVLGRDAVPAQSALDKLALTWRLMHLLPAIKTQAGFEPLAGFLQDGDDIARRLQLAQRLADLYDQYQVYRSDWLEAWERGQDGHDVLPRFVGFGAAPSVPAAGADPTAAAARFGTAQATPVPPDQCWQPMLWRALLKPLSGAERATARSNLHLRYLTALASDAAPAKPIARRVVLFGMTHVPMQTLEALAALAPRCQVILAIPNPSRYHWADIIEGRELLRMERRRQPLRNGRDLSLLSLEEMHAHGHPLLAAWGRQGRDFVRQLDAFDDAVAAQQRFTGIKIDLFDEAPATTLLAQVQAHIRDLVPLAEHPREAAQLIPAEDRSIVFHLAHGAQREVEILHDQLLALLAKPPAPGNDGVAPPPLQPRDIVVMVPDIAAFAPVIRSVFGQYPRGDARFIPFDITDLGERGNNPLLVALEWLLRLPQQRCRMSEIRDLLDVPAVVERFGLSASDLPRLSLWMEGAGVRWGLNAAHRDELGLSACGEQNSWLFGLRRMLLGYANGEAMALENSHRQHDDRAFQGIEPYAEVGGLEASLAGALADLIGALTGWWTLASVPATPVDWAERARGLLDTFMAATDERERLTLASVQDALRGWLEACDTAAFNDPVSLAVAREAWLSGIDEPGLNHRFRAGGVTFCTLLPMRAVPFEVVCLLGMNDGDYPRSSPRSDFDLMGLAGQRRPGDRSRRDDDRQLMLEALLSARRVLYVSWTGRSVRDNSQQPPSVLVSQLRDYLAAGWPGEVLAQRTTEHPLQPFSRRYFEVVDEHGTGALPEIELFTHAREWRAAHAAAPLAPACEKAPSIASLALDKAVPLSLADLTSFLKNPVKDFFRRQLNVVFRAADEAAEDDEAFALDGLVEWGLLSEVLDELRDLHRDAPGDGTDLRTRVAAQVARIRRSGRLPMAGLGRRSEQALVDALLPMLGAWAALHADYPAPGMKVPLHFEHAGLSLDDWLDGLQLPSADSGAPVWLELNASRLCSKDKKPQLRPDKLLNAWVRTLVASACGEPVGGVMVGRDATVTVRALPEGEAVAALRALFATWHEGLAAPLPLAANTALAWLKDDDTGKAERAYEGDGHRPDSGEVQEACLARMFPDYEALTADGRFGPLAQRLFGPLVDWAATHVSVQLHVAATTVLSAPSATRDMEISQ